MPRKAAGLTAAGVRKLGPGQYVDGNGLRLLVRDTGARFWLFRYTIAGKTREMGLGRAGHEPGSVPLSEARATAGELHRLVKAGTDPLAKRQADEAAAKAAAQVEATRAITFRTVAESYIAAHAVAWRHDKHLAQWGSSLRLYAYPHMGEVPVAEVTTEHVMAALAPIWETKSETASRVRGRIECVLDYAKTRAWRTGENPARWRGHLDNVLPARGKVRKVEHHAALPWTEAGAFMATLRDQAGTGALALRFAILTAARTSEVLGARWSEIDMQGATWTVPAARMKAGAEHRVPLSAPALNVLNEVAALRLTESADAFLFPSAVAIRSLSNMTMTAVLRRMKRTDLTVHGFRSTFRDWTAETTDFAREVAEVALAHTLGDKVEAAYRRGDLFGKRRELMEAWGEFCARPYVKPNSRVVALHPVAG